MITNDWHKSTRSGTDACVEVRADGDAVLVRDTKAQGKGAVLEFTNDEWTAFIGGVKDGEFDRS
jgi:hypothetical protein